VDVESSVDGSLRGDIIFIHHECRSVTGCWRMVKDECVGSPEEGTLEVLRRTSGSEKKKLLDGLSSEFVVEQKLAWIQALIPIDLQFYMQNLKCNNRIDWHTRIKCCTIQNMQRMKENNTGIEK
jgi:hypothetical protein